MAGFTDHIKRASFEAHMAAADVMRTALGVEQPKAAQVAKALAHSYGQALALSIAAGADNDTLADLGETIRISCEDMVSQIHRRTCKGEA